MTLEESIGRIQDSKEMLGHLFYETFLARHPEARKHFRLVDLLRQGVLLTIQLGMVVQHYARASRAAAHYLQILGTRHKDRGVPREMYAPFCAVLLETLAEFHGEAWDEQLAGDWRAALDSAVQKMFEGYERRYSM